MYYTYHSALTEEDEAESHPVFSMVLKSSHNIHYSEQ